MAHLVILCEGHTEQRILKPFLQPYWASRFADAEVINYRSNGALKVNFKADAERDLVSEPAASVLCLVDLYREPFGIYEPHIMTVDEGFKAVQRWMLRQIDSRFHSRFGAFPVVMEIETWLLADPHIQSQLGVSISVPETIPHPSAHLKQIYTAQRRQYGKVIDGINLFRTASARRVYEDACPHFNQLVDWLVRPPPALPDTRSEAIKTAQAVWEEKRDRLYRVYLNLEQDAQTEAELDEAIRAEKAYEAHAATYDTVFKRCD